MIGGLALPQLAVLLVAVAGCVTDLTSRRIPNALTLGAAAGAFGYFLVGGGWTGLGWSAAGWIVGLAMFLPLAGKIDVCHESAAGGAFFPRRLAGSSLTRPR